MKKSKKSIAIILVIVLVLITMLSVITVSASSESDYCNNFINKLLSNESSWLPLTSNSIRMQAGFEFLDLDFDGKCELVVQEAGGTMDNHSVRIYYYSNDSIHEVTGKKYGEYLNVYSLKYYYNKLYDKYFITGMNTCAAGFAADRWCGNYKLTYTNNTLNFYYYSSNYKEVNFTTYENIFTYYDGAVGYGNSSGFNAIEEAEYNTINENILKNCVDANLKSKFITKSDWDSYTYSQKRESLLDSYSSFSYNYYSDNNYFKLKQDTNQYLHKATTYHVNNKNYRHKLYWDSLNTWDSTFRIHDEMYSGETGGVCHGIALSMCYANNGNLDLKALNNGIQISNYWGLGSMYDSDKGRFKDLVTYYQLTQLTANGAESYSVERNGWHTQSLNKRLSDFLKKFKQDAERSQNEKKPFVLSFSYKHNNDVSGHSVVVCGYNYNDSTNEHEILIYDENTYPNVRYFIFKISSDYSSFTFTDANGEALGYMISDIWTNLEVYDIDKLYSGKNFSSISVVKGSEPVSASNTTQLNITAYKTFKVVNDRGEYLEYDGSNYNGNMNVYDCKLVDNLDNTCSWDITVNNSSKFVFSNFENDCEIIGETYSGGFYICSNYSDGFTINGKSVTVEGRNYDFDIALQTQSEKDFIRVSGKASGNTSVSDNSNTIEIKSDTYINAANVKSYEFDNISENNVENTVNNIMIDDESGEIVNSKKLSYTFGDINNDGVINSKDRMTLTRYIAKWNGIKIINDQASDVNYDGKVNAKDRMILTRHLAKWQEYEILPNNK